MELSHHLYFRSHRCSHHGESVPPSLRYPLSQDLVRQLSHGTVPAFAGSLRMFLVWHETTSTDRLKVCHSFPESGGGR